VSGYRVTFILFHTFIAHQKAGFACGLPSLPFSCLSLAVALTDERLVRLAVSGTLRLASAFATSRADFTSSAGTDFEALRDKYPNTGVYAIVRGTVNFNAARNDVDTSATIGGMDVETVQAVEPLRSAKSSPSEMSWHQALSGKPFKAEIAFGRRDEPWNLSVSSRADAIPPPPEPPKYPNDGRIEIKPD
jgi:hypothetical protein